MLEGNSTSPRQESDIFSDPIDDFNFLPEEVPTGIVEDDHKADLFLEAILNRQVEIDRLKSRVEFLGMRIGKMRSQQEYFCSMLEQYILGIKAANPKKSTLILAFGELSARKTPSKVIVEDDLKLTEDDQAKWPAFVRIKTVYDPAKKEIKDAAESGAEIPPWATVEPGELKATIKIRFDNGREEKI
jgi:hypothetical protein